jgi:glycosyltransferase involved in cell wall biosynthesis
MIQVLPILVSVIIPNYNHGNFLKQRIESVITQTFQNFEIFILDDCSTDNSRDIIEIYRKHPKVSQIIYNKTNSGSPFLQWQKGVANAKGEYVWIAESDDWADSAFLEKTVNVLKQNLDVGIVFCGNHWIDSIGTIGVDLSIHKECFIRKGAEEIRNFLVKVNTVQNVSSVLFRTAALKKVSHAYINYKSCGDWILYTELLSNSNIAFIKEKLNYFRFYHNNTSNMSSSLGLWQLEGVDVLLIAKKHNRFSSKEKTEILASWEKRISPLRKTIPMTIGNYLKIQSKLFSFAPVAYIRLILVRYLLKIS